MIMKKIVLLLMVAVLLTACKGQEVKKEVVIKKKKTTVKKKRKKKEIVYIGSESMVSSEAKEVLLDIKSGINLEGAYIEKVYPLQVKAGVLTSVTGNGFGGEATTIKVGDVEVTEILEWKDDIIWFRMPEGIKSGDKINLGGNISDAEFIIVDDEAIKVVWEIDLKEAQKIVDKRYKIYEIDEAPKLQAPIYLKGQWGKKINNFGIYSSGWDGGNRTPMYNIKGTEIWSSECYFTKENFDRFKRKILFFAFEDNNIDDRRLSAFESDAMLIVKNEWGLSDDMDENDNDPGLKVSNRYTRYNRDSGTIYVNYPLEEHKKERVVKAEEDYVMEDNNFIEEGREDNKIVIYQMMTRLFGNENTTNKINGTKSENGVGKFNDISDKALLELKKLGASHIWYTGVIEHAIMSDYTENGIKLDDSDVIKGRAGSPYAIKDYYDINPDLAVDVEKRMEEFESLVARTHDNDMKVIIDFVANHVSRLYNSDSMPEGVADLGEKDDKSKFFDANNNFYYIEGKDFIVPRGYNPLGDEVAPLEDGKFVETPAKVTGNDILTNKPSKFDWFETVKLNYGVDIKSRDGNYFDPIPDTWIKMRDILKFWTDKGVDGFRCDMAEMVPVEFWGWVIPQIKEQNSNVIFIAEIYNTGEYRNYIENGKFDYLYDKVGTYDKIRSLMQGVGNVKAFDYILKDLDGISSKMLNFLENHDEQRIASRQFAGDSKSGIAGMGMISTLSTGPVMIYFGQEVGEKVEGFSSDDGRTTIFDYWGVPAHQRWVNSGEYDGGKLSKDEKKLREDYSKLLNFIKSSSAIRVGDFYQVTYANKGGLSKGWNSKKSYAYLRWSDESKLLIVVNFDRKDKLSTVVKIPTKAFERMDLDVEKSYVAKELLFGDEEIEFDGKSVSNLESVDAGIKVDLEPMSVRIFEIK